MRTGLRTVLLGVALLAAASAAEAPKADHPASVVNAADYADPASPTAGLQAAVDALPAEGGVVILPPGEYGLRQAIRLRSNVTFQGAGISPAASGSSAVSAPAGRGTVLRKRKHAESRLAEAAQQGSRSLRVVDARGFAAGDQVAIRDKDAMGWNVVQAIITAVQGNELRLDRAMPRTCDSAKMGFVIHVFPAITAERASNIVIQDIVIQDDAVRDLSMYGPLDNPRAKWAIVLPFHVAAIHLNFVSDSRVERCSVRGWLSDGISVQGGSVTGNSAGHNTITDCVVEKCGGIGLHPGGGLHDSLFSHNVSRGNGGNGLYFCAGVQRVTVTENQLLDNQGHGIGGLGDFGDKSNTVSKNVISGNGKHGIEMGEGESNTVVDNTISNNSQSDPGRYSGICLAKTSLSVVQSNRCFDDQPKKTQKHGIEELANCRENTISDNDCRGHAQSDVVLAADQPPEPQTSRSRGTRGSAGDPSADRARSAVPMDLAPRRGRDASAPPPSDQPVVTVNLGPPQIVDYTDPTHGAKIRQLKKDDGHEHNFYYYRDPWNADGTRMLGIQSDLEQQNWRVCLYDGDGVFLKELFPISKYDWRLCWDRHDPDLLYTWKDADLYRFHVTEGQAELLKSFAPLGLLPNGPSCNQAGDRILVITSDRVFRSFHLPDVGDERTFKIAVPEGCNVGWDKPRYIGYRNYINTAYSAPGLAQQAIVVYDDTGAVVHTFDGIGGGGHYDFSPDGRLAYFRLPAGGRGAPKTPLEIHVINLDGSNDRVLLSVPHESCRFSNLHLSWPSKVDDWFVAGFFPQASGSVRVAAPAAYEPPWDEILMIRVDGATKYLARTGTVYSRAAGRGQRGDMFWAQPLPKPSADGRRICFNSIRSGTIDLHILYTGDGPPPQ